MNTDCIIATFIVIDTVLERLMRRSHALAQVPYDNILTVAKEVSKKTSAPTVEWSGH